MRKKEKIIMEIEKLLAAHLISKDKDFVESYKQNPPQVQEKLEWQPGEAIISELDIKDLIQLGSRYLNNLSIYDKNILHFIIRIERLLTWLLEAQGVNVQEKFKEDAKAQAELIEEKIRVAKEQLAKSVKN